MKIEQTDKGLSEYIVYKFLVAIDPRYEYINDSVLEYQARLAAKVFCELAIDPNITGCVSSEPAKDYWNGIKNLIT